jgi:hypothetical protein
MRSLFVRLLLLPTALVLLDQSPAGADQINFSYQWSVLPSPIVPGLPGSTGSVALTPALSGSSSYTTGAATPSVIPGATVTTTSSASNPPDQFAANFKMDLHLTDTLSGKSGDLLFSGSINGTLTSTTSQLTSKFNNPLTEQLTLGTHVYNVTIDPALIQQLPAPNSTAPALIDAFVTASDKSSSGGPTGGGGAPGTPEPSSLLLGATAMLGMACRHLVRARRKRARE